MKKTLGDHIRNLIDKVVPDGPLVDESFWIPIKIDKEVDDFSHKDYTSLTFKTNPGLYRVLREFRRILNDPRHNCFKLLREMSSNLDIDAKRKFLYSVLTELEVRISEYDSRLRFLLTSRQIYATAKVKAEYVNKLLMESEIQVNVLNKFDPKIQFDNYNFNNPQISIDNHILNRVDPEFNIHVLPGETKDPDPIDVAKLVSLIKWKRNEKGKPTLMIKDFMSWAIMPIINGDAEIVRNKKHVFVATLSKALNYMDLKPDSLKSLLSNSMDIGTFINYISQFIKNVEEKQKEKEQKKNKK